VSSRSSSGQRRRGDPHARFHLRASRLVVARSRMHCTPPSGDRRRRLARGDAHQAPVHRPMAWFELVVADIGCLLAVFAQAKQEALAWKARAGAPRSGFSVVKTLHAGFRFPQEANAPKPSSAIRQQSLVGLLASTREPSPTLASGRAVGGRELVDRPADRDFNRGESQRKAARLGSPGARSECPGKPVVMKPHSTNLLFRLE